MLYPEYSHKVPTSREAVSLKSKRRFIIIMGVIYFNLIDFQSVDVSNSALLSILEKTFIITSLCAAFYLFHFFCL